MERTHGRERDVNGRFMDGESRDPSGDKVGAHDAGDRHESRVRRVYGAGYAARDERPDAARRVPRDRH
jgi:hypothetical protein